jgi:hypothetical protein
MKEETMKRISSLIAKSLVTILIGSGTLAINLQAQSDLAMTASIPFPFTVGTQSMAPGTYEFSLVSSQFLVSVRNVKTGHQEMFPVRPGQQLAVEQCGRLKFRNSNARSILSEVHFPGTDRFSEVDQGHGIGSIEAKNPSTDSSISVAQR